MLSDLFLSLSTQTTSNCSWIPIVKGVRGDVMAAKRSILVWKWKMLGKLYNKVVCVGLFHEKFTTQLIPSTPKLWPKRCFSAMEKLSTHSLAFHKNETLWMGIVGVVLSGYKCERSPTTFRSRLRELVYLGRSQIGIKNSLTIDRKTLLVLSLAWVAIKFSVVKLEKRCPTLPGDCV